MICIYVARGVAVGVSERRMEASAYPDVVASPLPVYDTGTYQVKQYNDIYLVAVYEYRVDTP